MASAIINEPVPTSNPAPFAFESHQIRTVIDDGQPWFVAKDVAFALGIAWNGRILENFPSEWQRVRKLLTHRRGLQPMKTINEPAVYKLAFRSNKPEADRFTNWIASEVIPALRRTGKFEVCPAPNASFSAPARLTTAKERNALAGLVNRYVGQLPGGPHQEAYKAAWRKVHDVMGIKAIEDLTVEQLPRAVMFVQTLLDAAAKPALPEPETPALPPLRRRASLDDYRDLFRALPESPAYWDPLRTRLFAASEAFARELTAIRDESAKPFRVNRKHEVRTYFDAAIAPIDCLFESAEQSHHMAYKSIYDALEGFQSVWRLLRIG